ncbi:MAG TPA: pyridoxamine 5'-phosphate oxidase family protein [Candidatus Limnocylindria bacterium]|jgi:general stress protein 26|nr:pyridoxamine 5'-phosphate oxidase family protein [Candidatus Limnocylindria bacterium]
MSWVPQPVQEMVDAALVTELTVVRRDGRPITYPLIPLWDGERVLMTSSILFSRKLEHIKDSPHVSLALSDPVALGGRSDRATIQGDARVIDGDPHTDWESVLPLWSAKEPAILQFLKVRVAFPLFFERAVIEVEPRRVLYWPAGDTSRPPEITHRPAAAAKAA